MASSSVAPLTFIESIEEMSSDDAGSGHTTETHCATERRTRCCRDCRQQEEGACQQAIPQRSSIAQLLLGGAAMEGAGIVVPALSYEAHQGR